VHACLCGNAQYLHEKKNMATREIIDGTNQTSRNFYCDLMFRGKESVSSFKYELTRLLIFNTSLGRKKTIAGIDS